MFSYMLVQVEEKENKSARHLGVLALLSNRQTTSETKRDQAKCGLMRGFGTRLERKMFSDTTITEKNEDNMFKNKGKKTHRILQM